MSLPELVPSTPHSHGWGGACAGSGAVRRSLDAAQGLEFWGANSCPPTPALPASVEAPKKPRVNLCLRSLRVFGEHLATPVNYPLFVTQASPSGLKPGQGRGWSKRLLVDQRERQAGGFRSQLLVPAGSLLCDLEQVAAPFGASSFLL